MPAKSQLGLRSFAGNCLLLVTHTQELFVSCRKLRYFTLIPTKAAFKRKFHLFFKHWISCITQFGAPFWYSGEANEEFHKVACKVLAQSHCFASGRYLTESIIHQWAYKLTNKRDHEGQMVQRLVEFDAMSNATRQVPMLMATTVKHAPPPAVQAQYALPGTIFVPIVCTACTNTCMTV